MQTACTTTLPPPEPVVIEKVVNVYVTIPEALLDDKCGEPAVLKHGATFEDLFNAANHNRIAIEKCQNVIKAIINYNNQAKEKAGV
ncbi:hypothetical protein VSVS12_04081 [Vibrio scophthalmi]|nr:hypothetical protein VSVS12_04081 [Vibrio scophthalmi]